MNIKELFTNLTEALSDKNSSLANEYATSLYVVLSRGRSEHDDGKQFQVRHFLNETSDLLDWLLDISDELFLNSPSPIAIEESNFRNHLLKISDNLNVATVEAANQAKELIEVAVKEHQKRLHQLKKVGHFDPDIFCLFWKLWLLIDEMLRYPDFPETEYEGFVARLYGTIAPALHSKNVIFCLAKYRDKIFSS